MSKNRKKGPTRKESSENAAAVASAGNFVHKNTGSRFQSGNPHRFRPGKSGNPSGKPSAQRAVTLETVKDALGRVDPKLGTTPLERIVAHCIRRALQGSYKDKKLLLNYGLGMPKQTMDLDVFNYADALTRIQQRRAGRPTNGHTDPQTAQIAAAMPEQSLAADREDDAPTIERRSGGKIRVEL